MAKALKLPIDLPHLNVRMTYVDLDIILERAKFEENIAAEIIVRCGRPLTDEQLKVFFARNKKDDNDYEVNEIANAWLGWCKRATMRY